MNPDTRQLAQRDRERAIVAEYCKSFGRKLFDQSVGNHRPSGQLGPMSPRLTQTLELLLEGLSEKQVAARLQISRHIAHDYVKRIYKIAAVSSRAELLAKVLRQRSA